MAGGSLVPGRAAGELLSIERIGFLSGSVLLGQERNGGSWENSLGSGLGESHKVGFQRLVG